MGGWARRRGRMIAAVLGVCAVTIGAITLGTTGADEAVSKPLGVDVLDIEVEGNQVKAAVNIENLDRVRHEMEVFLTVGVFGSQDAWDRRVAETSRKTVAARSGETVLAVWDEPIAVPSGDYEITAWVRLLNTPEGQVVSATGREGVTIESDVIARVVSPGDGPRIAAPDLQPTGGDFLALVGSVTVEELSVDGTMKIDVVPAHGADAWWSRPAVRTILIDAPPDADGSATGWLDQLIPMPAGDYRLRVELLTNEFLEDQLLLPAVATVAPTHESISRSAEPVGSIALVAATTEPAWTSPDKAIVAVEVQNLSNEHVDGRFWWILSSPGEPEPWQFAEAKSFEVQRRLDPRERRTIRLALDGEVNVGRGFELSVWTHQVAPDDSSSHSDGVRVTALIDTVETQNGE